MFIRLSERYIKDKAISSGGGKLRKLQRVTVEGGVGFWEASQLPLILRGSKSSSLDGTVLHGWSESDGTHQHLPPLLGGHPRRRVPAREEEEEGEEDSACLRSARHTVSSSWSRGEEEVDYPTGSRRRG
ncbi:unnamed protein product [Nezara viridula]|uniref:Uncharacterized protein n=1 Tax=Nezara viridula TaxID=85310 RepID=A0A9P0MQQ6_NEZVI|nr:unnamed protein product [Nezara viridula]